MPKKKILLIVVALAVVSFLVMTAVGMMSGRSESRMIGGMGGVGVDSNTMMEYSTKEMGTSMIAPDFYPPYYPVDDSLQEENRLYEKSSNHDVVVDDVSAYIRSTKEYVLSIDGRILNQNQGKQQKYEYGSLRIKVPVARFEEASSRITFDVQEVVNESINADDITGTAVSIQDQLTELRDQVSLKEIELQEAPTTADQRRVQLEIDRLNRQIAQLVEQQDSVAQQVEYATIYVSASNNERYFNPQATDIRSEFENAVDSLKDKLYIVAYGIIWVLVYSVVWAPLVLIAWYISNRRKK
ncbi:MAG: DUF4349 domain-containing protein [Microgenomates group bacterium]